MSTQETPADRKRDPLPGYEVTFFCYSSGVTATLWEVAYRRGRRREISQYRYFLPYPVGYQSLTRESQAMLLLDGLLNVLAQGSRAARSEPQDWGYGADPLPFQAEDE